MGRALSRGGVVRGHAHNHRDPFFMGTAHQRNYRSRPYFPYEPVPFTANSNQPTNHTHQRHRRGDWMAVYPDTPSPRGSLRVVGSHILRPPTPATGALTIYARRTAPRDKAITVSSTPHSTLYSGL